MLIINYYLYNEHHILKNTKDEKQRYQNNKIWKPNGKSFLKIHCEDSINITA